MDFSYWLNIEENLLLTAGAPGHVQQLIDLAHQSSFHIGILSDDYPLLERLTVAENVALAGMYHQNLTLAQVLGRMAPETRCLDLEESLDSLPSLLDRQETLKVLLLRAVANNNSVVVLQRPPHAEAAAVLEWLDALPRRLRLWIVCLEKHAQAYMDFKLKKIAMADTQ